MYCNWLVSLETVKEGTRNLENRVSMRREEGVRVAKGLLCEIYLRKLQKK